MKEILEHYGIALLQVMGGMAAMMLWTGMWKPGEMLYQICVYYVQIICG